MTTAYVYYPTNKITIHKNPACSAMQKRKKQCQRRLHIDMNNLSIELNNIANRTHDFSSNANDNDMLIDLDFGNSAFEEAVMNYIATILAKEYIPFSRTKISMHQCK